MNQSHITTQLASLTSSAERGTWQEESNNNNNNHSTIFTADWKSSFSVAKEAQAAFFFELNSNYINSNMCTSTQQLNSSNHLRHYSSNFESSPFPVLRKRRVRFHDESCSSQVPQPPTAKRCRVDDSSSIAPNVLNHDELLACKPDLWVGRDDARRIRREARQQAHILRKMDEFMMGRGQGHLSFSETYANVYTVCHVGENGTLISPEILTFMSLGEGRGLEDQTSPRIAIERRVRRQQTIKMVVQAHARWTGEPDKVRQVSETLSAPSRRLAEALGYVDASASILACQESSHNESMRATTARPMAKANDFEVFENEDADMHGLDAAVSFDCPAPRGPIVATAAASWFELV